MSNSSKTNVSSPKIISIIAAMLFSSVCWYVSYGLSGDYWYLVWLAPIPILILSFRLSAKAAFLIAFIAYAIGRLSWASFLVSVATLVPAIIFTILLSLIFAVIVLITRRIVVRSGKWWAVFVFPVIWTTIDFLIYKYSADGSAASIAYTQSNLLPLIQIASVTGMAGISFFVTFFPSAIAVGWYHRHEKQKLVPLTVTSIVIILTVFLFGAIRISNHKEGATLKVGLAVLDEKFHYITDHPELQKEMESAFSYTREIKKLADQGARLVVLPERAINITNETYTSLMEIFMIAAKENHVAIVAGYTNFKDSPRRNSAMVINSDGKPIISYNKIHLVTGLENQFTPGAEIGLLQFDSIPAGLAICKDLDFPSYIRKYGEKSITFLCVPAWDFIKDDWLHARMAILRGVENGFSEIRTARQGRLTISDYTGNVSAEASTAKNNEASLIGEVSLQKKQTLYSRFGDWFGILNVVIAIFFILVAIRKRAI